MLLLSKSMRSDLSRAKFLAKWFEVRVTIKLFGRTVLDYKWPPDSDVKTYESEVDDA